MTTIPQYPAPGRPLQGDEQIPGWQDGQQRSIPAADIAALADRSLRPLVARAEAAAEMTETAIGPLSRTVVSARASLLAREPIANDYLGLDFGALTLVARGADIVGCGAIETWLETHAPTAFRVTLSLYSRPLVGAANTGAGQPGDRLEMEETRQLAALPGFEANGAIHRVLIDLANPIDADPARLYLLLVEVRDADGEKVSFSCLHGQGVVDVEPAYPQVNGFFREGVAAPSWTSFAVGTTAAVRWLTAERPGAAGTTGAVLSLATASRVVPVGAPAGVLGSLTATAGGRLWWNEQPFLQGGLVTALWLISGSDGFFTFHVGRPESDGTFTIMRSVTVTTTGAGYNRFVAGTDFDAFTVEEGWNIGLDHYLSTVRFVGIGNTPSTQNGGGASYERNVTLCFGGEIAATALPVASVDTKRRRVSLWRQDLRVTGAPRGWNDSSVLQYDAEGLSLADKTQAGWQTRASGFRFFRATKRLTRVAFQWTTAGARFAVETIGLPGVTYLDASFAPSAVEVDGAANQLRIKNSVALAQGAAGDPGNIAVADLGYAMTLGHEYLLEWSLDRTVHTATLVDLTTSQRSPLLISGDPDFAGVDTAEGTQNGAISIAFVAGSVTIQSMEVLYDAPSPTVVVVGDSISWGVLLPPEQSWVSILEAAGASVLCSAQPGGTSQGALDTAFAEIPAARPRTVILGVGTNDVLRGVPLADTCWCIASMIDLARRVGARIVLTVLHPLPGKDVTAHNAMITALAAGQSDIDLWRWDKALTLNGAGLVADPAKLNADSVHPNATGATALYLRLIADSPTILD